MPTDSKKCWRVVEFEVDARQEELSGWLMMQLGANGCEVDPADGGDQRIRLRATFELDKLPGGDLAPVVAALDEYGLNACIASLRTNELQEEDWLTKWKVGFEPFPVGERLLICPPWHLENLPAADRAGREVVLIEPGLAFGTGFHETTRFCLLALQDYVPHARRILDIGTGSGILSISSALLTKAAPPVIVAVETDPVACKNARENFEINAVSDRIGMLEGGTETVIARGDELFDLMLINLTYEDHVALLKDYVRLAQPDCHMIFAGILKEKGELMATALKQHGLEIVRREPGKAWEGFVARTARGRAS